MKITVAIDSFKGCLSSGEAADAAKRGILKAMPEAEVFTAPIADGGEGTAEAVVSALGGEWVELTVNDPLFRSVKARYGIINGTTAVIEMATAAGLTLLRTSERDPLKTTTLGVGEIIRDAIGRGCRDFIIGIGGSATNDGGIGMLSALGVRFFDKDGHDILPTGGGLCELDGIDLSGLMREISECRFRVACDVKNPLTGNDGCSAVFAPQKGADDAAIARMDAALDRYADLTEQIIPKADRSKSGAGAAGGLGFALCAYLGAELTSGTELVMDAVGLENFIRESAVVVTGEGRLDGQSVMGKVPVGVARLAKKHGKTVFAFGGGVTRDAVTCHEYGIDAIFPSVRMPVTLDEAMQPDEAKRNLEEAVREAFEAFKAGIALKF